MDVEFLKNHFEEAHDGVIVKTRFRIGVRHIQLIYMFMCAVAMGTIRGSVGIAVLAVTDVTRHNDTYIEIHDNWDKRIQGIILSSFFFGYALALVPANLIVKNIDGKASMTIILIVNGALTAALPTIINTGGWIATGNALFMMGMTQACFVPATHSQLSKWLVPNERQLFSSIVYGGIFLGIVISLPVSGILSQASLGWELIFYSLAMVTLSMAIICFLLTASSPAQHQAIGEAEQEFIETALKFYRKRSVPAPWRKILKTKQFWAVACAHAANCAVFVFFLTDVPAFLKTVGVPLKDCALYSVLPFVTMWVIYMLTAPTLEWMSTLGYISYLSSITQYRKFINGLGATGIAAGLTILPNLVPVFGNFAIVVLTVTLGLAGLQLSGFLKSLGDMSENFTGTLYLMTSGVASVMGALIPLATGFILWRYENDLTRWRIVFFLLATLIVALNVFYIIFGSSERQPWDEIRKRNLKYEYCNVSNIIQNEELSQSRTTRTDFIELK